MRLLQKLPIIFLFISFSAWLTACGGGGIGGGGDSTFECNMDFRGIAPATDGSGDIWVGVFARAIGYATNSAVRLNSSGLQQADFVSSNQHGLIVDPAVTSLAFSVDGSSDVYVGGDSLENVKRLNHDGSRDTGFIAVGSITVGGTRVSSISPAVNGSGDIYVGGDFLKNIIRLNSDGSEDAGFVTGSGFSGGNGVSSISLATDSSGDLYVGGTFTTYNGVAVGSHVRLNSDGSLDTGFISSTSLGNVNVIASAADATGDLYVSGDFPTGIKRYNSDGTEDSGLVVGSGLGGVTSIAPAADGTGAVYVGGWFDKYDGNDSKGIARLNIDGALEANFIVGSGFDIEGSLYYGSFGSDVSNVARATDGTTDIYVVGGYSAYNGVPRNGIARLNSDGSLDTSFDVRIPLGGKVCNSSSRFPSLI